jgi:hypothetical protein
MPCHAVYIVIGHPDSRREAEPFGEYRIGHTGQVRL